MQCTAAADDAINDDVDAANNPNDNDAYDNTGTTIDQCLVNHCTIPTTPPNPQLF